MTRIKPRVLKYFKFFILLIIYSLLFINLFILKDSPAAVISAFFGITYTILAGKGNPNCYLFGITGSGFYTYLALKNALWGNFLLYIGYYIPMQIIGFFKWRKHLKTEKNEIIKIELNNKERIRLAMLTSIISIAFIFILFILQDKNPVIDGTTTILSILGMYLTVRRAIEQWVVWMIVNGLSAIMWLEIALGGEKVYSTVFMWSTYFILAIYFYIMWRREIKGYIQ